MRVLVFLAALVLATSAVHATAPPAIRETVSTHGATYLMNVALNVVMSNLKNLTLPEIDGSASVPLLGTIDYHLNNIDIKSISYANAVVTLAGSMGSQVSGIAVAISANWGYRQKNWPHFSSSGSADITISDASMSLVLSASATPAGAPSVAVTSCVATFANIDVKIHGSVLSWLYDLIFDIAKKTIRSDAEKMVAAQVTTMINTMVNAALAKLPLKVPISATEFLDLSMVGQPGYPQNNGISFYTKGEFQNTTNPTEAPLPHASFADVAPVQMFSLDFDPFLVNSQLYLMYTAGKLTHMVTQADIPPQFPFKLNTTAFKGAIPALYAAYPNEAVAWLLNARNPPSLAVCPQNVSVTADFYMTWLAQDKGTWVEAFTLDMYLELALALNLNSTALTGKMALTTFDLTLLSSNVGQFDTSMISVFFNAIVAGPIVDQINDVLMKGFPVKPMGGVTLSNPSLNNNNGYITLVTDIQYAPPAYVTDAVARDMAAARQVPLARRVYNAQLPSDKPAGNIVLA